MRELDYLAVGGSVLQSRLIKCAASLTPLQHCMHDDARAYGCGMQDLKQHEPLQLRDCDVFRLDLDGLIDVLIPLVG